MSRVVIRISRPLKTVVGDVVPFFARDLARFASDADRRIGEETDFDAIFDERMPPLVRTLNSLADHTITRGPVDWGARASRVPAMASRHRELFLPHVHGKSLFRRDAGTNTRDACAPRTNSPIIEFIPPFRVERTHS